MSSIQFLENSENSYKSIRQSPFKSRPQSSRRRHPEPNLNRAGKTRQVHKGLRIGIAAGGVLLTRSGSTPTHIRRRHRHRHSIPGVSTLHMIIKCQDTCKVFYLRTFQNGRDLVTGIAFTGDAIDGGKDIVVHCVIRDIIACKVRIA